MAQNTFWQRMKTGSKAGFDKVYNTVDKLGPPVNQLSNKLGSEAFWPTTLDKESDKAARILKSFCKDGFYTEEELPSDDGPKQKQKVLEKIPTEVIQKARGLAIFTTMRTGLWFSGAGGAGVLVGRKEDGTWSQPSGIMLHTAGLGFLVGVDIYDCVIVLNTDEALQAFTKIRCTLGSEISVAAGPVGTGVIVDSEVHKRQAPLFTYLKSRGFYAGVQIDGTVVIERTDENERFYGRAIPAKDILAGHITPPPAETRRLLETIRAAQGDTDVDESLMPTEPPPSDLEIADDDKHFGVPDREDPDPYGVLALEKEGMSIKEAGTQQRASWESFSFHPNPTSPVHNIYSRPSSDRTRPTSRLSNWRASTFRDDLSKVERSRRSSWDRASIRTTDVSTQTDFPTEPITSPTALQDNNNDNNNNDNNNNDRSRRHSSSSARHSSASARSNPSARHSQAESIPENSVAEAPRLLPSPQPNHRSRSSVIRVIGGYNTPPQTPSPPAEPVPKPILPPRPSSPQTFSHQQPSSPPSGQQSKSSPTFSQQPSSPPSGQQPKSSPTSTPNPTPPSDSKRSTPSISSDLSDSEEEEEEEDLTIIEPPATALHSVQTAQAFAPTTTSASSTVVSRARLVTVAKRPPPPELPRRNPNRGGAVVDKSGKVAGGGVEGEGVVGGMEGMKLDDHDHDAAGVRGGDDGDYDDDDEARARKTTGADESGKLIETGVESRSLSRPDTEQKKLEEEEKKTQRSSMPGGFD